MIGRWRRWKLALALGLAGLGACESAGDDAPVLVAAPALVDAPTLVDAEAEAPPPIVAGPAAPTDPAQIGAWLRGGGYRQWAPRSAIHRASEHGGARVFWNPRLAASFAADAPVHPIGAAAVRELYEADLVTPRGFALMVKIGDEGERGWFWYEVFGVDDDALPTVAEAAAPGCVGCHSGGVDFVLVGDADDDQGADVQGRAAAM